MRRSFVRFCKPVPAPAAATSAPAEWERLSHRPWDYPSLADVPMWRLGGGDGPSPVLVLPSAAGGCASLAPLCRDLSHSSGCVGLDLPSVPAGPDWMKRQAELTLQFIDTLGAPWLHVVAHSVGGLLAAYLCYVAPARIGTVTLLDTPLVNDAALRAQEQRLQLKKASVDVNIPDETVAALKQRLSSREQTPPCPEPRDKELWDALLLGAVGDDLSEKEDWFLPMECLEIVQHPMLLVRTKSKAAAVNDRLSNIHRDIFNVTITQGDEAAEGWANASGAIND
eukprot:Hpha_TRINITY_DN8775_c0_g1::TRINITY_DN8775_c0_g1_i1::g.45297::m.45297